MSRSFTRSSALLVLLLTASALAVGTGHWTHTSEADFKNGTMTNVVATNLGDLKLSRAIKAIMEQDPKVSSVYALVETPDKTIYAGTGPQGVLLRIKEDKVSEALKLDDGTSIFSLALDRDGGVLIGTGGESGRVLRLDADSKEPRELFAGEGVQYIWCLLRTDDGTIYAGTGPDGGLYEIKPSGGYNLLLDTDENNLLCMTSDGGDLLYVGTDPNGLVYRVNRKTRDVYVMHDANESEISAIVRDRSGNIYAATAEAMPQEGEEEPATEQVGRPEGVTGGAPIPSPERPEPEPPKLPDPTPGEPEPIPKKLVIIRAEPAQDQEDPPKDDPGDDSGDEEGDDEPEEGMPAEAIEPKVPPRVPPPPEPTPSGAAGQPREGGNAIYRIDREGLVTELFRQPVLVLSLIEQEGTLLAGTGSDGLIYQINPRAEETIVLAKVEPKQVMSLLPASNERILLGLANTGGIAAMTAGFAGEGTFTSPVLDATQVSRFGKVRLHGTLPAKTTLKVSTRSGNVSEPRDTAWSKWSDPRAAAEFISIDAPAARFLQYRLTFSSADGQRSPIVDDVDVSYQEPNRAPVIEAVQISTKSNDNGEQSSKKPPEARHRTITWEASDPNEDELVYSLHFRSGSQSRWILLKDRLTEATYDWDTRSVADGRYEVRVSASDVLANAKETGRISTRVSDPIQVDNTPPVIGNLKWSTGAGDVRIRLDAVDRASTLSAFAYSVDSSEDWQTILPSDKIADGPEESVDFSVSQLSPGPHQITVRVTDSRGNQAMQTIAVTVDSPAKD